MPVNLNAGKEVYKQLKDSGFTAESILGQVDTFLKAMQGKTAPSQLAQNRRQLSVGIRGGGAPGTKQEAVSQIRELTYQSTDALAAMVNDAEARRTGKMTLEEYKIKHAEQRAIIVAANAEIAALGVAAGISPRVAILFKSGGPFLYTDSTPLQYDMLVAAGSSGRAVWQIGWGPNRSPTYLPITINAAEIIESKFVASSWVIAFYKLARPA